MTPAALSDRIDALVAELQQELRLEAEIRRMGLHGGMSQGALYSPDHAAGLTAATWSGDVARSLKSVSPNAMNKSLEPSLRSWTDKLKNAEAYAKKGKYTGLALEASLLARFLGFMLQEVRK